jgi:asparagine synthase (glutamine-hydrolysing)
MGEFLGMIGPKAFTSPPPENWQDLRIDDISLRCRRAEVYEDDGILIAAAHKIFDPDMAALAKMISSRGLTALEQADFDCALFIYLKPDRKAFLLRDRLGAMPVYFRKEKEAFLFSTDESLIREDGRYSPEAVYNFLEFTCVSAPLAFFDGVTALLPGEMVTVQGDRLDQSIWWDIPLDAARLTGSLESLADEFFAIFQKGLVHRTRDLDTVDTFLSGGLDTGTIVATLAKSGKPLRPHTLGFMAAGAVADAFDEVTLAEKLCAFLKIDHHFHRLKEGDVAAHLEALVRDMGQLSGDSINSYFALKLIGQTHRDVLLAGTAGDELVQGVGPWVDSFIKADRYHRAYFSKLPGFLQQLLIRWGLSFRDMTGNYNRLKLNTLAILSPYDRFKRFRLARFHHALDKILSPEFLGRIDRERAETPYRKVFCHREGLSPIVETMVYFMKREVAEGQCKDIYFLSQKRGFDVRFPYLYYRLVEFVAALPPEYIYDTRTRTTKVIMKEAVRQKEIFFKGYLDRPKKGFVVPLDVWLRGELKDPVMSILHSDSLKARGIFNIPQIRRMADDFYERRTQNFDLWKVVILELWLRLKLGPREGGPETVTS